LAESRKLYVRGVVIFTVNWIGWGCVAQALERISNAVRVNA